MRRTLLLLTMVTGYALPASAQSLNDLGLGDPVRVSAGGRTMTGDLVALSADSLRMSERVRRGDVVGHVEHSVAFSDIETAYVRVPRTRGEGALRGAIAGGVFPGTVLIAYEAGRVLRGPAQDGIDVIPILLGIATLGGVTLGASIGALNPGGRWVVANRVRVESASSGLGVRVTF